MNHATRTLTVIGLSLALTAWVAPPARAATPDAWITTKAKLALLTGEGPSALGINVDTVSGRVTLHGKVTSAQQKTAAEAAVKKIEGAQSVRNLLQVVPAEQHEVVDASDEQIKANVEKALQADAALEDSEISVQSVNQGVVLLAGKAKTLTDHLVAVEVTAAVPGVRDVASEIESPNSLADDEIWQDTKTNTAAAANQVKSAASDLWVTSAAKMMLLTDSAVPALDINVDTRAGVVTLFGIVPTAAAKTAAEADVNKVAGVKRVVNDLQVVPAKKQEVVNATDDETQERLAAALENHTALKGVDAEVKNGVARLTGEIPSASDRLEAAVIARSTKGVRAVKDDMTISN